MNVVVTAELRLSRTPDGAVWATTALDHGFFERYLDVFDTVRVVARLQDVPQPPPGARRSDGERVTFSSVHHYVGPTQYLQRARQIRRSILAAVSPEDAVVFRVPSQIASVVQPVLRRRGQPYGVEVIGDPADAFAPGAIDNPLRPLFRWRYVRLMARHCREAVAAGYVTASALQRRYPCAGFTTHYAGIRLNDEAFADGPRPAPEAGRQIAIIFVGSLAQLYKAPDTLIDAVAACVRDGLDLRLTLLGDGKHRQELRARADSLGIGERVRLPGAVPMGAAVRAELDDADLFVLTSIAEGLPKATLEAMARGLPCIGSTVGGFPELLDATDLVPPGDAPALAAKIREFVTDPGRMERAAARNFAMAAEYREPVLRERRVAFYASVREKTEQWQRTRAAHG